MPRSLGAMLSLAVVAGCATVRPLPPPTPDLPLAAWEEGFDDSPERAPAAEPQRDAPPPALAKTAERPRAAEVPRDDAPPSRTAPSPIPGSTTCVRELGARGVPFRPSKPVLGIATPVVLTGPLDGIRFYASDHRPFLADCRLVLALAEVAPELRSLGVSAARFSGAYVYKLTRPGRMSMHAYGLAVDVHAFKIGGETLEVKHDFERGAGCGGELPVLNRIACRIRAHHLFKEQLGPDDNAAHHDHFHLGLKPLPGELAEHLPMPPLPRRSRHVTGRARSARGRSGR